MKSLVLFDKIYNITKEKNEDNVKKKYLKYLNEFIKGFENTTVNIRKLRKFDQRFEIDIDGSEEKFVYNLLKKEVGSYYEFNEIKIGASYRGNLIDVGKVGFGIFVDCAILNPKTDVLLTIRDLRSQLCSGKKKSVKEIIKIFDFIDHFPVKIKISKINKEKNELEGILDNSILEFYLKFINDNLEGVFVNGATKNQVKKAIKNSGHLQDIISVERLGFLEQILILKINTTAPGIISEIGKYLTHCQLSAIRPERIRTFME
jgi:hypothetical protein